jgi:predicted hydrocarbon binding protein
MAIYQLKTRRPFLRGISNVSIVTLSAGAAVLAHALLASLLPDPVAIAGAIVAYTLATHVLVSSIFALREGVSVRVVFLERFLLPSALHVALGIAGGVAILGLWSFHPAAVAALLPFAWLARQHVQLVGRAERESLVHKRLADTTRSLVGERDLDRVAERILAACGDLFQAGRAELVVSDAGKERRWSREFEGGWNTSRRPLAARLAGVDDAPLGALLVQPNLRLNRAYDGVDELLLGIVASDGAAALANVRALRELDAAQQALLSQRVARPLVRRIVRGLMTETRADALVLLRMGEQLASGVEEPTVEASTRAYAQMGLGHLRLTSAEGAHYEFVGSELMEEAPGARASTCYLALGFLCGAVGRARGGTARGSEVACRSRGDPECRFVLQARPNGSKP